MSTDSATIRIFESRFIASRSLFSQTEIIPLRSRLHQRGPASGRDAKAGIGPLPGKQAFVSCRQAVAGHVRATGFSMLSPARSLVCRHAGPSGEKSCPCLLLFYVVADLHAGSSTVSSHRGRFINFRDSYFTQGRFHTAKNFSCGRVFNLPANARNLELVSYLDTSAGPHIERQRRATNVSHQSVNHHGDRWELPGARLQLAGEIGHRVVGRFANDRGAEIRTGHIHGAAPSAPS